MEVNDPLVRMAVYLLSFGIDPNRIDIGTMTHTGYNEWVDNNGRPVPVYRSWPTRMDVEYLFSLGYAAVEQAREQS